MIDNAPVDLVMRFEIYMCVISSDLFRMHGMDIKRIENVFSTISKTINSIMLSSFLETAMPTWWLTLLVSNVSASGSNKYDVKRFFRSQ